MIFLDTSALVKAYVSELGTEAVRKILTSKAGELLLSDHVALETLATFAYKLRDQRISKSVYRRARSDFARDYSLLFERVAVTSGVLESAMQLAHSHRKMGVGSIDLIHIATAIRVRAERAAPSMTVACADRSMRLLASAAGFEVFDPENDDVARLGAAAN